jgi:hypothetical protein
VAASMCIQISFSLSKRVGKYFSDCDNRKQERKVNFILKMKPKKE